MSYSGFQTSENLSPEMAQVQAAANAFYDVVDFYSAIAQKLEEELGKGAGQQQAVCDPCKEYEGWILHGIVDDRNDYLNEEASWYFRYYDGDEGLSLCDIPAEYIWCFNGTLAASGGAEIGRNVFRLSEVQAGNYPPEFQISEGNPWVANFDNSIREYIQLQFFLLSVIGMFAAMPAWAMNLLDVGDAIASGDVTGLIPLLGDVPLPFKGRVAGFLRHRVPEHLLNKYDELIRRILNSEDVSNVKHLDDVILDEDVIPFISRLDGRKINPLEIENAARVVKTLDGQTFDELVALLNSNQIDPEVFMRIVGTLDANEVGELIEGTQNILKLQEEGLELANVDPVQVARIQQITEKYNIQEFRVTGRWSDTIGEAAIREAAENRVLEIARTDPDYLIYTLDQLKDIHLYEKIQNEVAAEWEIRYGIRIDPSQAKVSTNANELDASMPLEEWRQLTRAQQQNLGEDLKVAFNDLRLELKENPDPFGVDWYQNKDQLPQWEDTPPDRIPAGAIVFNNGQITHLSFDDNLTPKALVEWAADGLISKSTLEAAWQYMNFSNDDFVNFATQYNLPSDLWISGGQP